MLYLKRYAMPAALRCWQHGDPTSVSSAEMKSFVHFLRFIFSLNIFRLFSCVTLNFIFECSSFLGPVKSHGGKMERNKGKTKKELSQRKNQIESGSIFPYPTSIIANHLKKCNIHRHTAGTVQIEFALKCSVRQENGREETRIDRQQQPRESLCPSIRTRIHVAFVPAAAAYNNTLCGSSP